MVSDDSFLLWHYHIFPVFSNGNLGRRGRGTENHTKTLKENLRRIRGGRELLEASSNELLCGLYPFGNCFAELRVPPKRDSRDGTGKVPWLGGCPTPVCELSEQVRAVLYFWVLLCWASLQVQVGSQAVFVDFRICGRRLWQIPLATSWNTYIMLSGCSLWILREKKKEENFAFHFSPIWIKYPWALLLNTKLPSQPSVIAVTLPNHFI